mmetsp:Transcript_136587/g.380718  ORF Transcript_136587/g.380718 Transcript_136587/m.380718 type:complete len:241 (+) Transcript_136587:641-1363(+)
MPAMLVRGAVHLQPCAPRTALPDGAADALKELLELPRPLRGRPQCGLVESALGAERNHRIGQSPPVEHRAEAAHGRADAQRAPVLSDDVAQRGREGGRVLAIPPHAVVDDAQDVEVVQRHSGALAALVPIRRRRFVCTTVGSSTLALRPENGHPGFGVAGADRRGDRPLRSRQRGRAPRGRQPPQHAEPLRLTLGGRKSDDEQRGGRRGRRRGAARLAGRAQARGAPELRGTHQLHVILR